MKVLKTNGFYFVMVVFGLALILLISLSSESAAIDASEARNIFYDDLIDQAFGTSLSSAGDFNNDGRGDLIIGAGGSSHTQGRAYIFYGVQYDDVPGDREVSAADANVILEGPSLDYGGSSFGFSVSGGGDFNGDGFDDVIVGEPFTTSADEFWKGCAYIFFGGEHSRADDQLVIPSSSADLTICGENPWDWFGFSVAMVGKLNDDDMDDIVIGAPGENNNQGKIYYFYGFEPGGLRPVLPAADFADGQTAHIGRYGYSVAGIGDFNNDGYDNFAVGAPLKLSALRGGGVHIWGYASSGGVLRIVFIIEGGQINGKFGFSVAAAGNMNGDDYDDLIIGAPYMDSTHGDVNVGGAYVILGRPIVPASADVYYDYLSMWTPDFPLNFPRGVIQLNGERAYNRLGYSVSTAGDLNLDDYDDVIVGAPHDWMHEEDVVGRAHIFAGRLMDNYDFTSIFTGEEGLTFTGEEYDDLFGVSVTGGFLWSTRNHPNVVIGAPSDSHAYLFTHTSDTPLPPPLNPSFPVSLQNKTHRLSKGSPFFRKPFDQGIIGFYFMEPEGDLQFWGEAPFAATVLPGRSVTLSVPWPTCSQSSSKKEMACSQPSPRASLFWTFRTTINGKQLYAFPENTNDPQEPQTPPPLSLASEGADEKDFQLFAFGDGSTLVGGSKVFHTMPAVAGVKMNPKVINLKSKGGRIKCTINLPDGLKERNIEPKSLLLSDPSCKDCQPIKALRGYATRKKYTAFFARKDLIGLIKMQQEEIDHLLLRLSGHMKFGNLFEGDTAIHVKRGSKKKKLAKKWQ